MGTTIPIYSYEGGREMLVLDTREIENKLLAIRKRTGMTQAEVTELAELSNRAYADIERETSNMRVDTILKICGALHITPDEILTVSETGFSAQQEELLQRLNNCNAKDKETALQLLSVFLKSLE